MSISSEELLFRIEKLETHCAFLDDLVDQLNHSLIILQNDNLRLKEQIRLIAKKINKKETNSAINSFDEKPPHY